eukprot:jgi/Botrbrau1/23444/Bobra.106_1s0005.1
MQSEGSGEMNDMSESDEAPGVIALSQWISNDAHFCEAKDADIWKNEHVAEIESLMAYVKRGKRSRRMSSGSLSTSSSGTVVFTASDHSTLRPEAYEHRSTHLRQPQISNHAPDQGHTHYRSPGGSAKRRTLSSAELHRLGLSRAVTEYKKLTRSAAAEIWAAKSAQSRLQQSSVASWLALVILVTVFVGAAICHYVHGSAGSPHFSRYIHNLLSRLTWLEVMALPLAGSLVSLVALLPYLFRRSLTRNVGRYPDSPSLMPDLSTRGRAGCLGGQLAGATSRRRAGDNFRRRAGDDARLSAGDNFGLRAGEEPRLRAGANGEESSDDHAAGRAGNNLRLRAGEDIYTRAGDDPGPRAGDNLGPRAGLVFGWRSGGDPGERRGDDDPGGSRGTGLVGTQRTDARGTDPGGSAADESRLGAGSNLLHRWGDGGEGRGPGGLKGRNHVFYSGTAESPTGAPWSHAAGRGTRGSGEVGGPAGPHADGARQHEIGPGGDPQHLQQLTCLMNRLQDKVYGRHSDARSLEELAAELQGVCRLLGVPFSSSDVASPLAMLRKVDFLTSVVG